MNTTSIAVSTPSRRSLEVSLAALIAVGVILIFWSQQRYPALLKKLHAGTGVKVAGPISFDALLKVTPEMPTPTRVMRTSVNWLYTNRFGMYFASAVWRGDDDAAGRDGGAETIFVGCGECIVRRGGRRADGGVHELCNSCGTESSGGWREHAADDCCDDQFAQLQSCCGGDGVCVVSSAACRDASGCSGATVGGSAVAGARERTGGEDDRRFRLVAEALVPSLVAFCRTYLRNLLRLTLLTLPWMLLAAVVGALMAQIIPAYGTHLSVSVVGVITVAILGTLLPVPMALDVALAYVLYHAGVPAPYVAVLLCTLGPVSIYSLSALGKQLGWQTSLRLGGAVAVLGSMVGLIAMRFPVS